MTWEEQVQELADGYGIDNCEGLAEALYEAWTAHRATRDWAPYSAKDELATLALALDVVLSVLSVEPRTEPNWSRLLPALVAETFPDQPEMWPILLEIGRVGDDLEGWVLMAEKIRRAATLAHKEINRRKVRGPAGAAMEVLAYYWRGLGRRVETFNIAPKGKTGPAFMVDAMKLIGNPVEPQAVRNFLQTLARDDRAPLPTEPPY